MRLPPSRAAEMPDHMSPSRKSGRRLLHFMISITGLIGVPLSMTLIPGRRSPSWKSSFASFEIEPGTMPPTSFQCAMFAVQATSWSPAKTGIAKIDVVQMRDAAVVRVVRREHVAGRDLAGRVVELDDPLHRLVEAPTKAGMPAPDAARLPSASVMPVPMSRTS